MALTPQQQQFLDNYVRKHSVKGKGKRKRADGFSAQREAALDALFAIPKAHPDRAMLDQALADADQLGEALKFGRAADAMVQLVAACKQAAASYDPTPDFGKVRDQVDTIRHHDSELRTHSGIVTALCGPGRPALAQQLRPVDMQADLPDRALVGDKAWTDAALALIKQRSADLVKANQRMRAGRTAIGQLRTHINDLTNERATVEALVGDVSKGLRAPMQKERLVQEMARMWQMLDAPELAVLRVGKRLDPAALGQQMDDLDAEFLPMVVPLKQQLEGLRGQVLALVEQKRPAQQGPDADNKYADNDALEDERFGDAFAAVTSLFDDAASAAPRRGKAKTFDSSDVFKGVKLGASALGDSAQDVPPDDAAFKSVVTVARNLLKQELAKRNLSPDSDEIFDLTLQSAADFGKAYALSQGWDLKKLKPGQRSLMAALGQGMYEQAKTMSQNRLDANAKQVHLGGQRYGKPKLLAKGGMGAVYRYESETNPGQFIVLKSLLDDDPERREDMVRELRGHRHLMEGMKGKSEAERKKIVGADNVVGLKGAVVGEDGSLHMAMEMVSGGDMEDNRHALDAASDLGVLPEEVRSLLNRSRMKQAVEGLMYMRDQNVVHFDIKGANFMVADDGTVKVADFGSASVGAEEDGSVKVGFENVTTAGYAAPDADKADSSQDIFALGKMFEVAHMKASTPQKAKTGAVTHKPLTGALARVVEGMTKAKGEERSSLEAVLGSSYLDDVETGDPETLKKLSIATIAYGKALKAEAAEVRKALPDQLVDTAASRTQVKPENVGFTALSGAIRLVIEESQAALLLKRSQIAKATTDEDRHDIHAEMETLQLKITEHKGYLAKFGQSPEAKKLAAELRQLSEEVLRPQDPPTDKTRADLLHTLKKSASSPAEFCNLMSLRSNDRILREWGVEPEHMRQLAKLYQMDLSPRNEKALDILETGNAGVQELMATVTNEDAHLVLSKGFLRMMRALFAQYRMSRDTVTQ